MRKYRESSLQGCTTVYPLNPARAWAGGPGAMESLKSFFKRRSWPSSQRSPAKSQLHRDSSSPGNAFVKEGLGIGTPARRPAVRALLCGRALRAWLRCARGPAHWLRPARPPVPWAGALEYAEGSPASSSKLAASSAWAGSSDPHFGYEVCVLENERARIADMPTSPCAPAGAGKGSPSSCYPSAAPSRALQQPSSAPGGSLEALRQSVLNDKRRAEGLSLHCAGAMDPEEANPYSPSRDITPAASTRSSYNWRKIPGSPNGEPLQVSLSTLHCPSASCWCCCVPLIAPVRAAGAAAWCGPSFACASRGGTATKPWKWRCDQVTADATRTFSLLSMQTIESEDVPSIDRLALEPSATAKHGAALCPPPIAPAPEGSSSHASEASMVVQECGAGVYSPREVIRPVARPEAGRGPPQIRNIPPLDQTPLWTQGSASPLASSSSSSRSVVPTPKSWAPTPRAPVQSSSTLAASTSRPLIPSWEVDVVDDDIDMYVDVVMPGTRESQNPGRDPEPKFVGVSGLQS